MSRYLELKAQLQSYIDKGILTFGDYLVYISKTSG